MESKINSKEVFFLHGTSEEAAQSLVNERRLKLQFWNNNPLNNHKGFIFFVPYTPNLPLNSLLIKREYYENWEEVLEMAKDYASINARDHYTALRSGYYDEELCELHWSKKNEPQIFPRIQANKLELDALERVLERAKKNGIKKEQAISILEKANKRKGAIIALGNKSLELKIEENLDEGICIYLPNGLDTKYVAAIEKQ